VRAEGPKSLFESGAFNRALPPLRWFTSLLRAVPFGVRSGCPGMTLRRNLVFRLGWVCRLAAPPGSSISVQNYQDFNKSNGKWMAVAIPALPVILALGEAVRKPRHGPVVSLWAGERKHRCLLDSPRGATLRAVCLRRSGCAA
jgi:hypothetical protein